MDTTKFSNEGRNFKILGFELAPENFSYSTETTAISLFIAVRFIGMLFLGFSAGLPFLLVFSTLSAWLKDAGISLAVIGFFGWVGMTYSITVFWG